MAESWDSNNLYWARLADEMGYSPEMLNRLVPQLTRRMVERTFATHLEDWPAVLRAMRETGEEFRQGKNAALLKPAENTRTLRINISGQRALQFAIHRDVQKHRAAR